ncbi:MAG: hypothetical protein K2X81_08665 [Candidatus Obscuribacterales bacterium]|nr:hypothetical protein [Candidatus Obscuribacterales bacterium]
MNNIVSKTIVTSIAALMMGLTNSSLALADNHGYYGHHDRGRYQTYTRTYSQPVLIQSNSSWRYRNHGHHRNQWQQRRYVYGYR